MLYLTIYHKMFFSLLLLCASYNSYSQNDSTTLFKQQNGKLPLPVNSFSKVVDNNYSLVTPSGSITFKFVNLESVKSIYDGRVVLIHDWGDSTFSIDIKYGDYQVFYHNIVESLVKKDDYIKAHQVIGK